MDRNEFKRIEVGLAQKPTAKSKKEFLLSEERRHPKDLILRMKLGFLFDGLLNQDRDLDQGDENPIFAAIDQEYGFSRAVKDVALALNGNDFLTAEVLVDELLPSSEALLALFQAEKNRPCLYFHEPFDQILYFYLRRSQNNLVPWDVPFDLGKLFYDKGQCLRNANLYEEARIYFKKAIAISPMSMALRLGLYETYLHPLDLVNAKACLLEDFQYVHNATEIARLYRELATLAEEAGDDVQAQFLHVLAISYCENENDERLSFDAIEALGEKASFPYEKITPEQIHGLLAKYRLPLGADPDFISCLQEAVRFLADEKHQYGTAVALAESLVSLSGHSPESETLLAHSRDLQGKARS